MYSESFNVKSITLKGFQRFMNFIGIFLQEWLCPLKHHFDQELYTVMAFVLGKILHRTNNSQNIKLPQKFTVVDIGLFHNASCLNRPWIR